MENVITESRPPMDSHFLLLPCFCGNKEVVYQEKNADGVKTWRVRCYLCGRMTTWHHTKHDAQIDWNHRHNHRQKII